MQVGEKLTLHMISLDSLMQDQPEQLRDKLEKFLTAQDISYKYSAVSKFANFIKKTLD